MNEDATMKYQALISSFLSREISASQFERKYLDTFQSEQVSLGESAFNILNKLFADVDAFCPDPELRDESDIDEDQLRARCSEAICKLKKHTL